MRVLLTGATGFIGGALISSLIGKKFDTVAAVRLYSNALPASVHQVVVGSILPNTEWRSALINIDIVIHAAARVHVMDDSANDPLSEFRRVNLVGTLNLARQAAQAYVKRFIFISSIKVNGESTQPGKPFTPDDHPAPQDPYGISKCEAEIGLRQLAEECAMEVVIIRPPLVYGPGVKANFQSMMRWISRGIPLPLGAIFNKRSLVSLDNLVDLIITCIDHPAASNQTFLAGDGEDLSTTELLQRVGLAMGRPARLVPVPERVLKSGAALIGKQQIAQRLCGSLQVDISKTCSLLNWTPPVSVDDALHKTTQYFQEQK